MNCGQDIIKRKMIPEQYRSPIQYPTEIVARTFKLDTRSAVSSKVNWLIWSTICVILGFAGAAAAASVDSHRRLLGVRAVGRYVDAMRREDGRTEPESCLQQRAAAWVGKDITAIGIGFRTEEDWIEEKHTAWGGNRGRQLRRVASEKTSVSVGENLGIT